MTFESHPLIRKIRHPERWELRNGELAVLFGMKVGHHTIAVPYTVHELKRIANSMEPDRAKEGIYPAEAAAALDFLCRENAIDDCPEDDRPRFAAE